MADGSYGNLFDRLGSTMQSPLFQMGAAVMSSPQGVGGGILQGAQAAQQAQKFQREQSQQTARDTFLSDLGAGKYPGIASAIPGAVSQFAQGTRDPSIIGQTLANQQKSTDDIREFEYAKQNGYAGTFDNWMRQKREGQVRFGLQPIPYQKPDGTVGYMVPNTAGETRDLAIPGAGGRMLTPTHDTDLGTSVITRDKYGTVIGTTPKDIAGAAAAREVGTESGKAEFALPAIENKVRLANKYIDELTTDPTLKYAVGVLGNLPAMPGTAQADVVARIQQVQGMAFLAAFESLRGGGQISNVEGEKASVAFARLQRPQSIDDAIAALNDLKDVVNSGLVVARKQADMSRLRPGAKLPSVPSVGPPVLAPPVTPGAPSVAAPREIRSPSGIVLREVP